MNQETEHESFASPISMEAPCIPVLELFPPCNNHCIFCHAAPETTKLEKNTQEKLPTYLEAIRLATALKPPFLLLAGSEPMNYPYISKLFSTAASHKLELGISTNGRILSSKKLAERLPLVGLRFIEIGIHSLDQDIHNRIAQHPDAFKQTIAGIKHALALSEQYNIQIAIRIRLLKQNLDTVKEIIQHFYNQGIYQFHLDYPNPINSNLQPDWLVSPNEIADMLPAMLPSFSTEALSFRFSGIPPCIVKSSDWGFPNLWERIPLHINDVSNPHKIHLPTQTNLYHDACNRCSYQSFCSGITNSLFINTPELLKPYSETIPNCLECNYDTQQIWIQTHALYTWSRIHAMVSNGLVYKKKVPGELIHFQRDLIRYIPYALQESLDIDLIKNNLVLPNIGPSKKTPFLEEENALLSIMNSLQGAILDVGAGNSLYASFIENKIHDHLWTYTALEPDPTACSNLKQSIPESIIINQTIEHWIPNSEQCFDAILVLRSWNHLQNLEIAMTQFKKLLVPGGRLIIVDNIPFILLNPFPADSHDMETRYDHYRNHSSTQAQWWLTQYGFSMLNEQKIDNQSDNQWMIIATMAP